MILYGILFSLLGAIATGAYGYWKGYDICKKSYESAYLRAEIKRLSISNAYLKSSVEAAKQIEQENQNTIQGNEEIIIKLAKDIEDEKAKNVKPNCVLTADFLRTTDNLK